MKAVSEARIIWISGRKKRSEPSICLKRVVKGSEDWEEFDQAMNAFEANEFEALAESEAAGHRSESMTEKNDFWEQFFLVIITFPFYVTLLRVYDETTRQSCKPCRRNSRGRSFSDFFVR